ncbi:hypothetical protein R1flu_016753 [Riccia fluitans]|uniref:Calmodulin-binding protein n=1 Tax=Riccia fluitans TaxID=41844 RepID=A0ABD1YQS3_9MARC
MSENTLLWYERLSLSSPIRVDLLLHFQLDGPGICRRIDRRVKSSAKRRKSQTQSEFVWDQETGRAVEEKAANAAAVQVQRLYRGYQTRRNIADAAVMAQKFGWWNVVDGAMLQHNSTQFYAYSKPQNAAQRWVRLKKKAAKVGKGLSKNEQARKLALQHWLEAIDPRHRYGHNLHFYYKEWSNSDTQEPFFYWLDVGEGKDLDLECCKRSKLQKEQISYLSPKERKWFEVLIEDGKLVYKMTEKPVDTPNGEKWIFVMSTGGKLYVGKKEKGKLQHSSFLAGGATIASGRLHVRDGMIELMEAHSGHYLPTPENFTHLIAILSSSGVDLTMARVQYVSDDMLSSQTSSSSSKAPSESASHPSTIEEGILESVDEEVKASEVMAKSVETILEGKRSLSLQVDEEEKVSEVMVKSMETILEGKRSLSLQVDEEEKVSEVMVKSMETILEGTRSLSLDELDKSLSKTACESETESLKGFKLEIIEPSRVNIFKDENPSERATQTPPESPSVASPSAKHKLFGPAMRTFSRLDNDYCSRAVREFDSNFPTSDLNPDIKRHLMRRLSMRRQMVPPI